VASAPKDRTVRRLLHRGGGLPPVCYYQFDDLNEESRNWLYFPVDAAASMIGSSLSDAMALENEAGHGRWYVWARAPESGDDAVAAAAASTHPRSEAEDVAFAAVADLIAAKDALRAANVADPDAPRYTAAAGKSAIGDAVHTAVQGTATAADEWRQRCKAAEAKVEKLARVTTAARKKLERATDRAAAAVWR
jgi:hypothetical protein